MDMDKQVEHVARQLFEHGNIGIIESAFNETYVAHDGDKKHCGHKFVSQFIGKLRAEIPDIKISRIEILSQAQNTVTWQRTFRGTHKQKMRGIPASMRKVTWTEIVVSRFEGEKIAEEWLVSNLAFQLMIKQREGE